MPLKKLLDITIITIYTVVMIDDRITQKEGTMAKDLTLWKEGAEIFDDEGNTYYADKWFCSDGISTFFADTRAEAAAHFGVPLGFDN
ncbi:MAG: hypothetical protein PHY29_02750 [Syntrophales bacterium]|nr:hypothetical protein [Syntrophales bacterium]